MELDPVPFVVETLLGFEFTGNATNDSTTVVQLNNFYQVLDSNDRKKGIRISSGDKQISVHGLNYHGAISDAFLALPCPTRILNEYVYYALTYHSTRKSQLLFVACEDNTIITIGSHTTIFLNKMETYLFENASDLTGTVAISNNPVSFFSGHPCTNVPTTAPACDHLFEQLPDKSTWGTHFLSASFAGRDSGEIYRVLASEPSTTVTFTCSSLSQPSTYTLPSAGSWEEITTSDDSFCSIVSNNPVLVVQFALGYIIDEIGDPFMAMIPAIAPYSNNYIIPIFPQFIINFVTIFVLPKDYQPGHIYVDDVSLEHSNWTVIYCPSSIICGYSTYVSLAAGDHQIRHKNKTATIGVIAYGFDITVAYGYPGGFLPAVSQGMFSYVIFLCSSQNLPAKNMSDVKVYYLVWLLMHGQE